MFVTAIRSKPLLFAGLLFCAGILSACGVLSQDVTPPPEGSPLGTINPASSSTPEDGSDAQPTLEGETDQAEQEVKRGAASVRVINHSGDAVDQELVVRLEGYDHADKVFSDTQIMGRNGKAAFTGVPLEPGLYFFAAVEYQNAVYRSDLVEIEEDSSSLSLKVDLFGTTSSTSTLSVDRVHVFLDMQQEDQLQVGEIFIISNYGHQTVVAETSGEPVLHFPLPEGADNLEFENGSLGGRFVRTQHGFGDTASIPPGSGVYQVMAFFTLPYQGKKLEFVQEINYPVGAVIVLTPVEQLRLKGSYLEDLGVREIQNGSIHVYAGGEISRGGALTFQVTGGSGSSSPNAVLPLNGNQTLYVSVGVLGLGLIILGVVFFLKSRREDSAEEQPHEEDFSEEQTRLLDAIIALDELYQEGDIPAVQYRRKRKELKTALETLLKEGSSQQ
jgi:hypothetical protein